MSGTAGSATKRSHARSLGGSKVFNSRSTEFSSDAVADSQEFLLNSLTSPGMIAASLSTLSPHGSFAEIAKRDVFSRERMAQERADVCYKFVALDMLPVPVVSALLDKVSRLVSAGFARPPATLSHHINDTSKAMRSMSRAQHIGKIVLKCPKSLIEDPGGMKYRAVITGGMGSLAGSVVGMLKDRPMQEG